MLQEQPHDLQVAILRRIMQWRPAILRTDAHGTMQLNNSTSCTAGLHSGRGSDAMRCGAGLQQDAHLLFGVFVGAALEEQLRNLQVAIL